MFLYESIPHLQRQRGHQTEPQENQQQRQDDQEVTEIRGLRRLPNLDKQVIRDIYQA